MISRSSRPQPPNDSVSEPPAPVAFLAVPSLSPMRLCQSQHCHSHSEALLASANIIPSLNKPPFLVAKTLGYFQLGLCNLNL